MTVWLKSAPGVAVLPRLSRVQWLTLVYASIVALGLSHFLLGIPVQYSDGYGNILKLFASWPDLMVGEFKQRGFLRPGIWAQYKVVYDAAGGDYTMWFRWAHVVQVFMLVFLYVGLVRPRSSLDLAVLPLGLAVLLGVNTFYGTVSEAFPINHFLSILLCCFAAAYLALTRYHWWNDVLAVLLFVGAALSIESGLLVAVVFVAATLTGTRGVSRIGVTAVCAAFVAYFVLRFVILDVGAPGLEERSSGFGFSVLEPSELIARFGTNPLGFYIYNVVASLGSVLFAEPSGGRFVFMGAVTRGDVEPWMVVKVVASMLATITIATFVFRRRRIWFSRQFDHDDQLVGIFLLTLLANAVVSYPYTKDVVMSPAGGFFAVAVFVAVRELLTAMPARLPLCRTAIVVVFLAALGVGWGLRAAGLHLGLRESAIRNRNEWAYQVLSEELDALGRAERELFDQLRSDAVYRTVAPPEIWNRRVEAWMGDY